MKLYEAEVGYWSRNRYILVYIILWASTFHSKVETLINHCIICVRKISLYVAYSGLDGFMIEFYCASRNASKHLIILLNCDLYEHKEAGHFHF